MISELSMTLLPEPVDPAISRCGIDSSAATLIRPLMSLPSEIVSARMRIVELVGFQNLAQADHLAPRVRNLDAHRRLAGDALDQDRFGLQAQAQVFGQRRDAAVLDAGFGLELERGHHRAGVDLHHGAVHVEFFELGFDAHRRFPSAPAESYGLRAGDFVQQLGGRQPVLGMLRHFRSGTARLASAARLGERVYCSARRKRSGGLRRGRLVFNFVNRNLFGSPAAARSAPARLCRFARSESARCEHVPPRDRACSARMRWLPRGCGAAFGPPAGALESGIAALLAPLIPAHARHHHVVHRNRQPARHDRHRESRDQVQRQNQRNGGQQHRSGHVQRRTQRSGQHDPHHASRRERARSGPPRRAKGKRGRNAQKEQTRLRGS